MLWTHCSPLVWVRVVQALVCPSWYSSCQRQSGRKQRHTHCIPRKRVVTCRHQCLRIRDADWRTGHSVAQVHTQRFSDLPNTNCQPTNQPTNQSINPPIHPSVVSLAMEKQILISDTHWQINWLMNESISTTRHTLTGYCAETKSHFYVFSQLCSEETVRWKTGCRIDSQFPREQLTTLNS